MKLPIRRVDGHSQSGQVVVLFAISLVAIIAIGSLVYTGAQTLVLRRQLQNVGDAAALAAANMIQDVDAATKKFGCSLAGPGGAVRQTLIDAAKTSVSTNLASYDLSKINSSTVTCPVGTIDSDHPYGYNNMAVSVSLTGRSDAIFGGLAGSGLGVATSSVAINGEASAGKYSVVMLDRSNLAWAGAYNGCPSFLIGGGITATFEGSIMVDSKCAVVGSYKGAMDANGASATVQMANGATIRTAGEYNNQNLTILPPGTTVVNHARPFADDPLSGLTQPDARVSAGTISLPTYKFDAGGSNGVCHNYSTCVLSPGIYTGGIAQTGSTKAICLQPGVYIMDGGGFEIGGGAVATVPAGTSQSDCNTKATATSSSWWDTNCALGNTTCGVLIYNTNLGATVGSQKNTITVGASSTVRLRAYIHNADATNGSNLADYDHILFWQDRWFAPATKSNDTGAQTPLSLSGGGSVILSGTVYAPGAQVLFGGTSGGSGGSLELTVQFICWDLQLQGNTNFTFHYSSSEFPYPTSYGLVQ